MRGLPVRWSLTQRHFEGIKFTPWGVLERIQMGLSSDWFNGRKVKLNLGAWEHLFTDIVLSVDMGGNKEVTGAVGVFQVCTFIVSIDLHKCPVHGDLTGKQWPISPLT